VLPTPRTWMITNIKDWHNYMKAVLIYNPPLFGTKLAQWILLGEFQHPRFQMDN